MLSKPSGHCLSRAEILGQHSDIFREFQLVEEPCPSGGKYALPDE